MSAAATSKVAAVWIVVLVLAVDPGGWYPFGPIKWLVVTTGLMTLTAVTLRERRVVIAVPTQLVMAALVVVFAVAAARGSDGAYSWAGTPERHFGAATWLLLALSFFVGLNLADPQPVLWGVALAGLGVGACAALEAVGWEPRVFDVDDRLSATTGSPAYLGALVAVLLPVTLACACDPTRPRPLRVVAATGTPLLVVAVLGSGARAAWLGLAVAGSVTAWRFRGRVEHISRRTRLAATGGVAVLAVVIVAGTPVGARLTALFDDDAPGGRGRLDEWRVAARVVGDHLALGVGPEGYRIAFAEGVDPAYERSHGRDPAPDRAHAAPLDIVLTGGAGALMLWLAVVALVGRFVVRALRDQRLWLVGLAAALIAHVSGQMMLFPLAELEPIVWLLAGVVVASTARAGELRAVASRRIVALVAAAAAAFAFAVGVADVVADRRAREATLALARGDTERAHVLASDAAALRPDVVRLHLLKAETARAADRGALEALAAIDDARAVSSRDPIVTRRRLAVLVERAEATLVPAHALEAQVAVAAAVARDPNDAQLRLLEGRAARLVDDDAAAEQAWRAAEALAPRSAAALVELATLYLDQRRFDDARTALERAAERAPSDARVATVRARLDRVG
jgi:tetratricopeptide (TPR) repeat protein